MGDVSNHFCEVDSQQNNPCFMNNKRGINVPGDMSNSDRRVLNEWVDESNAISPQILLWYYFGWMPLMMSWMV